MVIMVKGVLLKCTLTSKGLVLRGLCVIIFQPRKTKPMLYTGYLLIFKFKNMSKLYYRIAHEETQQGLWYDSKGNFTGLIHNEFNFCMNTNLPMPFDPDLVGWLSATDSLEDLFNWFSKEDIERLENHGWFITVYEAEKVKKYKNHLVICQETSLVKERLSLACV